MKKILSTLFVFLASVSMANAAQYLQASSTITQCPGKVPEVVKMDITDAADGLAIKNNKITVSEAGAYLIVAAPQVGREGGGPLGLFRLMVACKWEGCSQFQCTAVSGCRQHGERRHYIAGNRPTEGGRCCRGHDVSQ